MASEKWLEQGKLLLSYPVQTLKIAVGCSRHVRLSGACREGASYMFDLMRS